MCRKYLMTMMILASTLSAAALETEVLFDGTNVGQWDAARDAARLSREFSLSELSQVDEPPAFSWRFVSKGVAFNDVFLRVPVRRDFLRLRVRVMNVGEPFTLAAKVRDARGAEWTANQVKLTQAEDWQWVEFPREQWKVASWSRDRDGKMDFPLAYFTLVAFGVRRGPEYSLRVARVEAQRPQPPIATIHELHLPSLLEAGRAHTARLSFSLSKPCKETPAELIFRQGNADLFRAQVPLPKALPSVLPGERIAADAIAVRVPKFAFAGRHSVLLRLGEARARWHNQDPSEEVCTVNVKARTPGKTTSRVGLHSGAPTLFINGKPHNGMAYMAYRPSVEVFSDFAEAGVDLFSFSGTPTESGYGLATTVWTGLGEYDYSQLDQRALMVLEANPDAYFFPRLYVHAPKWWSKDHPDDVVLMDPGDGKYVPFIHSGGKPAPSWASERWRRDTVGGLRRLIAHVDASPYADRVIGYHIASGTTEEWMMWGANERQWVDYSPVNVARFREWLRARYGTAAELRQAWRDDVVDFRTAQISPKAQRQKAELGSLRDPSKERAVIDFYLYNSDLVADTICYLAKAVKEITQREKTVGIFYGYLLQLCGEQRQQNAGHLALGKVLASPDIDFLCSPTSYAFRQLGGEGTSHFMSLLGSVKLHGKLWFDENDIRTSLSPGKIGGWGKPADVAGDVRQQDKELANVLVNGVAQWWFDVGSNRYDDPQLMQRIGELTASASETIGLDRTPVDEMAMVVDEKSLCYLKTGDRLGRSLLLSQLPALHRIGAPVGHYLVTDLPKLADRKMFLITTSVAPTPQARAAIDALKCDGHVLVFCYAPGLYRDGRLDVPAMAELTSIKLAQCQEPVRLRVTIQEGHATTEGLDGISYGENRNVFPAFYVDDVTATAVGKLPNGRTGLAVRDHGEWTAVYSSAPLLPTKLLRNIAQLAGVHLYVDTEDVVWAARDLVSVSVTQAGVREVKLRRRAKVTDLYTRTEVAADATAFRAEFAERSTRVFVLR